MNTPIIRGLLQSDIDFAGHKPLNADMSDYGGGGGGSTMGVVKNVKAAPYNATGNGSTDDTAAIQSAINDVFAAGGGTVFFPQGVYLCNGPFDATNNSVLSIPFSDRATGISRTIEMRGEVDNIYSPLSGLVKASIIKCTKTGSTTRSAILAGATPGGWSNDPTNFNNTQIVLRNLGFTLPNTTVSMSGVRLELMGWAVVESCSVLGGALNPPAGTIGLWMPNTSNYGRNWLNNSVVGLFDVAVATGELFRCPNLYVVAANTGVQFHPAFYLSIANVIIDRCSKGVSFPQDFHPVDLRLAIEHSTAITLTADIYDPSNYGRGEIRYIIGSAESGHVTTDAVVNGGVNIHKINLWTPYP